MLQGFRNFIARGNVIDLAVGVIIGAGLRVDRGIAGEGHDHPVIGLIGGQPDFSAIRPYGIRIGSFAEQRHRLPAQGGGSLLLHRRALQPVRGEAGGGAAAGPTPSEALLAEIRDILKKQSR